MRYVCILGQYSKFTVWTTISVLIKIYAKIKIFSLPFELGILKRMISNGFIVQSYFLGEFGYNILSPQIQ